MRRPHFLSCLPHHFHTYGDDFDDDNAHNNDDDIEYDDDDDADDDEHYEWASPLPPAPPCG
eukprot:12078249-Karenia_brevis.AAC.1